MDLAAIIYTSGSTGEPKGVMLTHLNMVSASRSIQQYLGLREDDVILCALPLSFDYGLYQVLMAFNLGARVALEMSFTYLAKVLGTMQRERVTVLPGVPTLFAMLAGLEGLGRYDLSSLRAITNTAAALSETQIRELRGLFPKAQLFSMYGLTECKRVTYLPPAELDRRPTSVGKGMPNEEVYLVDEEGRELPPGSTGELVVRGSNVMRGYWNKPEETARCLRPGRYPGEVVLHTGDLFRTDEEGFLYFVARKDDIIKSRGEKVSPREVEEAIHRMPGVAGVAVVGVPDPLLGEAVKAFVVLRAGASCTERDVVKHCLAHLESFMAPRYVEFVPSLPLTGTGKVSKFDLRKARGSEGP
jgi:acyl-CoA synthetase (AMP-forming)/AMP-acid ligase II